MIYGLTNFLHGRPRNKTDGKVNVRKKTKLTSTLEEGRTDKERTN